MSPYLVVPLLACISSAVLAAVILLRDPSDRASRRGGILVIGAAWWAFCEVLWNPQSDAGVALFFVRASALGWVAIGPSALHLFLEVAGSPAPRLRRMLPFLYAASAAFLAIDWFTPWIHTGVFRTSWGWAYRLGPVYSLFYAFTVGCMTTGLAVAWRAIRSSPESGEREQLRWVAAGISIPLIIASLTDGLLPLAGHFPPRLGTASFATLGATIFWSFRRYGYSLLAPGTFAREILGTLPDGVAMLRLDGRVRTANGSMAFLLDAGDDGVEGLPLLERLRGLPGGLGDELREASCELITLSGAHIPVCVSSALLRDKQGSRLGWVVVLRDQQEVVSLRNRLVLSGRLAAVGELAAGIAHEINNPLAFVRSNLALLRSHWEILDKEIPGDARGRAEGVLREGEDLIEESLDGVDRAVAIIRDVKGLSHAGSAGRELADLNALLDGVIRMASPQLRGGGRVEKSYGDIPAVACAPQELQQVFLNLVLNAGHAISESGAVTVSSEVQNDHVVVVVEDDGCGIEPLHIDRIFDPFFTTKPMGEGTGLGLGIAYEIIRRHGGTIDVASEPGHGSRFRVRLPLVADTIPPA